MRTTTALLILDGFGYSENKVGNAILKEGVPNIKRLMRDYPHTLLNASGKSVGLPEGQMGNSEVGHLNMGAGRVIYQDLTLIDHSIEVGSFKANTALNFAINSAKASGKKLHIIGLCSNGGVHSHINHMKAVISLAHELGLNDIFIHCFTDGRDTAVTGGISFISETNEFCKTCSAKIATIMGRFYAMDRDKRYDRLEKAYNAMVIGDGSLESDPVLAVQKSYDAGITDEFIKPIVLTGEDELPIAKIENGDSVIFCNFRPDRARELTSALIMDNFDGFNRKNGALKLNYVTMSRYEDAFDSLVKIAFPPETIENSLGEYISEQGLTQLRIAETEKYAHVTFFFNGGEERMFRREDRALIPSPKVTTYDEKPEMSAFLVTDEAIRRIKSEAYDLIIMNLANCDMVGHTGDMKATVTAVSVVDSCVARIVEAIKEQGGRIIITADHGNAEYMLDESGNPCTYHTTSKVPLILIDDEKRHIHLREGGSLCDIAPTILELLALRKPKEMKGESLIGNDNL
ncbi:MAG: 2,3-bisphosphoglycerate-independent phosphoglycerate mutase [Clostridia bacterium]